MKYLAKIYIKNNDTLVMECCDKEIQDMCYPSGKCKGFNNAHAFRTNNVIIGERNIAISKEAIKAIEHMITKNSYKNITTNGDFGFYESVEGKIVFYWSDAHHKEIKLYNKISIGHDMGVEQLKNLQRLTIVENSLLLPTIGDLKTL